MSKAVRKYRDTYAITPGAPFYHCEFGFYCLDEWQRKDFPKDANLAELFGFDEPAVHYLGQLGWTEAALRPAFEVKVIEDRGEHEVVQDQAGRHVLYFKGRRDGFMPEYLDHPVKDWKTWEENVKWRLDPRSTDRFQALDEQMARVRADAARGMLVCQQVIGGYMYLRSLAGPETLLYLVHDQPDLLHDCMKSWLELADAVTARHQQNVTFDEIFFGEDICYNHGPLISPRMIREFLFPYYRQLIANVKARQIDKQRPLYIHLDTDGLVTPVIPLYRDIGINVLSPLEVASGCDVVEIGRRYPEMVLRGGIDKRVLGRGKAAIDEMAERIFPVMRERGGYIPTCDHGVPAEVSLDDYRHYRKRCLELGG